MSEVTAEQREALEIAAAMIKGGIPVFAAPPCRGTLCGRKGHENGKVEYDLPAKWQLTVPSMVWLDRWEPGWALGAVGGHVADFLDEDPHHGGEASIAALEGAGQMPRVFGVQETPSGGRHYVISPLHERETNSFMPGLDYQGGLPDGKGRAFIWIAPTVKRSKAPETMGELRAYRWAQEPDLEYLAEFEGSDDTIEGLRDRILARKVKAEGNPEHADREQTEERAFTEEEAQRFCGITLERLEAAEPGGIEDAANSAAVQLSHFVPDFWTEDFAFAVLHAALEKTAYDPGGPSDWTAEKFHDVLAGVDGRAPGDWVAVRKPESVREVVPELSAVDALLAEMRTPSEVRDMPRPRALIKGLLNLDSESWLIGEPGSKKSFVALDMAGHVARGQEWQGFKVTRADVVMIVAEGAGGIGSRITAWEKLYGPMPDNISILPRPVQAKDFGAWAVLVEACRRLAPGLVVIDTQARVTVGLEENSATEMGIYIEAVRATREATAACVLTVHHTGRKGGDARGSSAIDGAQHTELKVSSEGLQGSLSTEKQKDLPALAPVPLKFEVIEVGLDEDGDPVTSLALVADAFRRAVGDERPGEQDDSAVHIEEPGAWTARCVPESHVLQRRILQVMRQVGGQVGRTESKYREIVLDAWYPKPKRLAQKDWSKAWTSVIGQEVPDQTFPDEVVKVVSKTGERYWLSPEIALD